MPRRALVIALMPLAFFALLISACDEDSDAAATRDSIEREAREQLNLANDQIAKLEEQVRSPDVDDKVRHELDSLKATRDDLDGKLREARNDSREAWQDLREEVRAALSDLRAQLDSLWANVKDRLDSDDTPGQGGDR